jgi:hypothetical protein
MLYYRGQEIPIEPEEILDYLRKSQSDDPLLTVEEVLSKHETLLDEWSVKNLGAPVPEQNKFREVVSGETLKGRPEITKILRLIESPRYKAVKVVEPQRLTRGDLEDIGRLMKLLKHTNTLVITLNRIYDLRDEDDWDALERELKRGNEYLEYTKKILNRGRLLSVSQGNYLGSVPPYGYDRETVIDGKRKCPTLKENKEKADIVRMIFDLYVNHNYGRHKICKELNELKAKPPKGDRWKPTGVRNVLENIHYIGKVRWNWRKTVVIVDEGEFLKTRPCARIGEYLIYEGRHEGIISDELFNAAQEKLGSNPRVKKENKLRNPLAGILYCQCGRSMIYQVQGKGSPRLVCPDQSYCGTSSCVYGDVEKEIIYALKHCIEDFEVRIENDEGDSLKLHNNLIKALEKKMEQLKAQELSQWEQQSHPDESQRMPPHIFKLLNEKVLKEKEEVHQALCKAYESMPEPVNYEEKIISFTAALDALQDPNASALKKNALLKKCISYIKYSRKKPKRRKTVDKFSESNRSWTSPPVELDIQLKV